LQTGGCPASGKEARVYDVPAIEKEVSGNVSVAVIFPNPQEFTLIFFVTSLGSAIVAGLAHLKPY